MSQPTHLEECAQAIMEAVPPVMHFIRQQMRQHGSPTLSVPQFRALAYLNRHPGASLSDVAEHLGITRASISTLMDRLVQNGMVTRVADPEERRRSVLTLTEAGASLLKSARAATRRRMADALATLTPEQVAVLAEALPLLHTIFREVSVHEHDSP